MHFGFFQKSFGADGADVWPGFVAVEVTLEMPVVVAAFVGRLLADGAGVQLRRLLPALVRVSLGPVVGQS